MKYLVMLAFMVSCSSKPVQLSDKAKDIEVITQKPTGCTTVAKVMGKDSHGSRDLALNDALNQAADFGATKLQINQEVANGSNVIVHATGYKCD